MKAANIFVRPGTVAQTPASGCRSDTRTEAPLSYQFTPLPMAVELRPAEGGQPHARFQTTLISLVPPRAVPGVALSIRNSNHPRSCPTKCPNQYIGSSLYHSHRLLGRQSHTTGRRTCERRLRQCHGPDRIISRRRPASVLHGSLAEARSERCRRGSRTPEHHRQRQGHSRLVRGDAAEHPRRQALGHPACRQSPRE